MDPAAVRYWLLVGALAVVLASVVGHALSSAEAERARWGRTRTVWVATAAIGLGDPLGPSVRSEPWPAGLVPPGAVHAAPTGRRAARPIAPGEPITSSALVATGDATRRRSVSLPLGDGHLPVEAGDRVQVWATADPTTVADGQLPTRLLAPSAVVDRTGDGWAVVLVQPDEVRALADAAATATITLVGTS